MQSVPLPLNRLPMHAPAGHPHWAFFSPNGERMYSGGYGSKIWVWNLATFELVGALETGLESVWCADLHPSEDWLAVSNQGNIDLWAMRTLSKMASIETGHRYPISQVRFAKTGQALLTGSFDGAVRLNDAKSGKRIGHVRRFKGSKHRSIHGLAVSSDSTLFGALYYSGLEVWNKAEKPVFCLMGSMYHGGKGQEAVAFLGNDRYLWGAFRSAANLCVWDLQNLAETIPHSTLFEADREYASTRVPKPIHSAAFGESAWALAVSPDEQLVAIGLRTELLILSSTTYQVLHRWPIPLGDEPYYASPVTHMQFSPNGRLLYTLTGFGGLWLWAIPPS